VDTTVRAGRSEGATLLLTAEEAARELRIGRTRMYALIKSGEVVSFMLGGSRRIPYDELVAYTKRLVVAAQGAESREAA
jgi:excisionase family DNA binding protein